MIIFKYKDGTLKEAPDNFDVNNPDFSLITDVDEVLCVNKVLVKQVKLVVKPREERDLIRKNMEEKTAIESEPDSKPAKKPKSGRK